MTKPTGDTDWGLLPDSLKLEPTAKMKTHGWTTSDDTITGSPPKPTLQHQNGWNYNVSLWMDWLDDNFPALLTFGDLWKWDTGGVFGGTVDPFTTTISITNGVEELTWERETSSPASTWAGFSPDCLFGAKFLEFYDMMGRGLSLKIIDAASVEWIIYNPLGEGLADPQTEPVATILGELDGSTAAERILQFSINSAADNIAIVKDGVVVSDFTGFTTLTSANFVSNNPDGIRVGRFSGSPSDSSYSFTTDVLKAAGRPTRRWIRPCNHSSSSVMASDDTPAIQFRMDFEPGISYRYIIDLSIDSKAEFDRLIQMECSLNVATVIGLSYISQESMVQMTGGFMMPPEIVAANIPALKFDSFDRAIDGRGRSGDISGIYNFGNHLGSMIWVSERY